MADFSSDRLLNEREAAEFLAVSVRTLQKQRLTGGGPVFIKMVRSVRYRLRDLHAYVDARAVSSTSAVKAA